MSTNNNQYGKEVKPIWKNSGAETQKIMKLSGAKLQSMVSNDLAACTALTLSNRGITKLEDLVGFGDLLHRVDLSGNSITRLQGFNSTPGISMLNVSSNEIAGDASLEDLRYLTELRTLNIGNNTNIKYIRSHVAKPLQKLQALIAHECGFEKISFLKFIPNLNTLILSKNSISDFSVSEVGSFANLTKLSIGHNMLKSIPDLSASVNLTELRIGHNLITNISDSILHNKKLKTLDISHNLLTDWEDVKILVGLPNLTNLGLKDNNFPPPPESIDDLEVREDKAAEGIEDIIERRFRRFVLSLFLRVVGVAGKTFEQLIVLDMKRVKMKLTPGMSGEVIVDEKGNKGEKVIKMDYLNKIKIDNEKKNIKINPVESDKSEKIKMKKSKEIDVKLTEIAAVKELKSVKRDSKKRSPVESVEAIISSDSKGVVEKKKRKTVETDGGGFLDSNENEKSVDRNEPKSVKILSGIPTSSAGSGVVSVVDHKKIVKGEGKKSKTSKDINNSSLSSTPVPIDGKLRNIKVNNVTKKIPVVIDDVSVSAVLLGNSTFVVGTGGNSSW